MDRNFGHLFKCLRPKSKSSNSFDNSCKDFNAEQLQKAGELADKIMEFYRNKKQQELDQEAKLKEFHKNKKEEEKKMRTEEAEKIKEFKKEFVAIKGVAKPSASNQEGGKKHKHAK
jgi:hypothetical protein